MVVCVVSCALSLAGALPGAADFLFGFEPVLLRRAVDEAAPFGPVVRGFRYQPVPLVRIHAVITAWGGFALHRTRICI